MTAIAYVTLPSFHRLGNWCIGVVRRNLHNSADRIQVIIVATKENSVYPFITTPIHGGNGGGQKSGWVRHPDWPFTFCLCADCAVGCRGLFASLMENRYHRQLSKVFHPLQRTRYTVPTMLHCWRLSADRAGEHQWNNMRTCFLPPPPRACIGLKVAPRDVFPAGWPDEDIGWASTDGLNNPVSTDKVRGPHCCSHFPYYMLRWWRLQSIPGRYEAAHGWCCICPSHATNEIDHCDVSFIATGSILPINFYHYAAVRTIIAIVVQIIYSFRRIE